MNKKPLFNAVVLAGGGNRCIWQLGVWAEAAGRLDLRPETAVGVSAGATMACGIFAGGVEESLEYMKSETRANEKNAYWSNLLRRGAPVFPHHAIYRRALLTLFDRDALARLHSGPEIRILLARPPRWAGPRSGSLAGMGLYTLEKMWSNPVHSSWARKIGFSPEVVTARDCRTPEELAAALLASSCTPPFVPVMYRDDRPVLDGGLVDNAPASLVGPDEGPVLVLLTRRYDPARLPRRDGFTYLQPSRDIEISKWDYTNPEGMQKAYDQGRRDGEVFARVYGEAV